MKLVRTPNVAMMTDELAVDDMVVARPTCGYMSASMSSSSGDEVYRWRAQLYVDGDNAAVELEQLTRTQSGETSDIAWYVRGPGGFARGERPAWAKDPIDTASGS